MSIIGWKLDRGDREWLLDRFPPIWPDVIADHVTLASSKDCEIGLPPEARAMVVGHVNDESGLQALVVEIGDTTDRPDGSTFHITWSIDRAAGREPKDSNEVLARLGWERLKDALPVTLAPARWSAAS